MNARIAYYLAKEWRADSTIDHKLWYAAGGTPSAGGIPNCIDGPDVYPPTDKDRAGQPHLGTCERCIPGYGKKRNPGANDECVQVFKCSTPGGTPAEDPKNKSLEYTYNNTSPKEPTEKCAEGEGFDNIIDFFNPCDKHRETYLFFLLLIILALIMLNKDKVKKYVKKFKKMLC